MTTYLDLDELGGYTSSDSDLDISGLRVPVRCNSCGHTIYVKWVERTWYHRKGYCNECGSLKFGINIKDVEFVI